MSFPQVVVVCPLELVLDHDPVASLILSHEIDAEAAGSLFAAGIHQIQIQGVVENIEVLLEPSREVVRLVGPHFPKRNPPDLADVRARSCHRLRARTGPELGLHFKPGYLSVKRSEPEGCDPDAELAAILGAVSPSRGSACASGARPAPG
jgi:hypothetical protein